MKMALTEATRPREVIGGHHLQQGGAHDHADGIHHSAAGEQCGGKKEVSGETEPDHRETEEGYADQQRSPGAPEGRPVSQQRRLPPERPAGCRVLPDRPEESRRRRPAAAPPLRRTTRKTDGGSTGRERQAGLERNRTPVTKLSRNDSPDGAVRFGA